MFHIPSTGKYLTAWRNWLATRYKHRNQNFPDEAILCWFSGFSGAGHVVVYVPGKGFYSSPYSPSKLARYQQGTNTHAVLPSIAQIEKTYGVTYVGWSEDIEDKRVAEPDIIDDMVPRGVKIRLYQDIWHKSPTEAQINGIPDKVTDLDKWLADVKASDDWQRLDKRLANYDNLSKQLADCKSSGGGTFTVLKKGNYRVE